MGKHTQPGLDGRHRDNDGEIHRKRADTLLGTIRKTDPDFASGYRSDMKLGNYLKREGFDSFTDAKKHQK